MPGSSPGMTDQGRRPSISFQRLCYRPSQREQALLDENGHLADITDGLLPLLENARLPLDAAAQFVDLALVAPGRVLELAQLEHRGANLISKFLLLAGKSLDPFITSLRS